MRFFIPVRGEGFNVNGMAYGDGEPKVMGNLKAIYPAITVSTLSPLKLRSISCVWICGLLSILIAKIGYWINKESNND